MRGSLFAVLAVLAVAIGAVAAVLERPAAPPAPLPAVPAATAVPTPAATPRPVATPKPRPRPMRPLQRLAAAQPSWRRLERRARQVVRRLSGQRRAELSSVLAVLDGLAAAGRLDPSRLPLAFTTLRRNVQVWTRAGLPSPGQRMSFGPDPAVFQYYAGRGVQHHALASAGRINALVQPCLRDVDSLERRRRAAMSQRQVGGAPAPRFTARCHRARLRASLESLARLSSRRGGFVAFEYLFAFGQGSAPWVSGMAQATAAQALARGARAFAEPRYRRLALGALGAFEVPTPVGVRAGGEYVMYSFAPDLRIINGFLQSVIGLHDVAELTGSARARRLFRRGERVARRVVGAYDTGAWSLYSHRGRESTLDYHELVTGFLGGLCDRLDADRYCATERRFTRYLHQPPTLRLAVPSRGRARRVVRAGFRLDKGSTVRLTLRGPKLRFKRTFPVSRGRSRIPFTPPRAGRYLVRVQATGPEGRRVAQRAWVKVKPAVTRAERRERRARARARAEARGRCATRGRAGARRGGRRAGDAARCRERPSRRSRR